MVGGAPIEGGIMKTTMGLALASGLFLMVAGCAAGGAGGTAGGGAGGPQKVASAGEGGGGAIRNFNLEVKCPGVNYLKTHGKSDSEIMEQMQLEQSDIDACVAWQAAQPKGYVPPPPPGSVSSVAPPAAAPKAQ
jgi:hypothetical protein